MAAMTSSANTLLRFSVITAKGWFDNVYPRAGSWDDIAFR